jgi:hypothetical protein
MREAIVISARQLIVKRQCLLPHHAIITTHNHMEIRILGNLLLCRRHTRGLAGKFKFQNSNLKKYRKPRKAGGTTNFTNGTNSQR